MTYRPCLYVDFQKDQHDPVILNSQTVFTNPALEKGSVGKGRLLYESLCPYILYI
jgi:hypothetical protein